MFIRLLSFEEGPVTPINGNDQNEMLSKKKIKDQNETYESARTKIKIPPKYRDKK